MKLRFRKGRKADRALKKVENGCTHDEAQAASEGESRQLNE